MKPEFICVSMTISAYCRCGDYATIQGSAGVASFALESFWQVHSGEGHGPCDKKTAAKARRAALKKAREAA